MSEWQLFLYGGPDCLKFVSDTVVPTPKDDEVQLKVMAAGVNVIDTKIRKGTSFAAKARGNNFPWVLGFDVAGEVMAVPNAEVNWQKVIAFAVSLVLCSKLELIVPLAVLKLMN